MWSGYLLIAPDCRLLLIGGLWSPHAIPKRKKTRAQPRVFDAGRGFAAHQEPYVSRVRLRPSVLPPRPCLTRFANPRVLARPPRMRSWHHYITLSRRGLAFPSLNSLCRDGAVINLHFPRLERERRLQRAGGRSQSSVFVLR
ncbi:hypothetical protein AAFF_G00101130 [Aldrovandia affinis]|uniref:Uncharacterized protein n=1 Tax=Aldrovandia affinis TaxID=143900 RepID=A0AAD7WBM8_9TELE|nr:hypothetical protein AAFF_G00101130 [Aldrovandia affinis]